MLSRLARYSSVWSRRSSSAAIVAAARTVEAYRSWGHRRAALDPLGLAKTEAAECAALLVSAESEGSEIDLAAVSSLSGSASVSELRSELEQRYAGSIGYEFMHIPSQAERDFFVNRIEAQPVVDPTEDQKIRYAKLMKRAEALDLFMHKQFSTFKRYSGEGQEPTLVVLDSMFASLAKAGAMDLIVGMPHRGRFNVLCNLLGFEESKLFSKIVGNSELPDEFFGTGDVTSHLFTSRVGSFGAQGNEARVSFLPNPSHLEAVNPVAVGKARAKQRVAGESRRGDRVATVLLHGDAAFAGQGIVAETFSMANLEHFTVGGTIHLVVNNQVGFTADSKKSRSTTYCTDIAKIADCPILHVNGQDIEAVHRVAELAVEYRDRFRKDIVIDLQGYRLHGHNELDEPSFTNPRMYQEIRKRHQSGMSLPAIFSKELSEQGIDVSAIEKDVEEYSEYLRGELQKAKSGPQPSVNSLAGFWEGLRQPYRSDKVQVDTGVDTKTLRRIALQSVSLPENFKAHSRLERMFIAGRQRDIENGDLVDWGTAEAMAFGSLLLEQYDVRISGQDSERGTFSQRHGVFCDQETEEKHIPLNHLSPGQGLLIPCSSLLSENAVLGFEYGYSIESPRALPIWEAQFGDFANGAQVIIDNFVATGAAKWLRQSGLVMLLPHGFDGMGPEHSSGRMERFLQLSDVPMDEESLESNIAVANLTTPANYFHALRRQQHRDFRVPLVIMAPKGHLRRIRKDPPHFQCASPLEDFATGTRFQPTLDDCKIDELDTSRVKSALLCSGQVYYDLVRLRDAAQRNDVTILRVEEVAPFPSSRIVSYLERFPALESVSWCQEEHENMGAWSFVRPRLEGVLKKIGLDSGVTYRGRAASPCVVGSKSLHAQEVAQLHSSWMQ